MTRFHGQASVRRASLWALSRILTVLPRHLFISCFGDDLEELVRWLTSVADAENDKECRELGVLVSGALRQLIQ